MLYVKKILIKMPDCKEKEILLRVFVNKEGHQRVADIIGMDRSNMYKKINKFISKFM